MPAPAVPARLSVLARTRAALVFSLPALAACTVSNGFKGPGYDPTLGVTAPGAGPVVVAVTEATLKPGARAAFIRHVRRVEADMDRQPGLVGYSLRTELLGRRAWTLTVWQDEESLRAFARSPAHRAAVREQRAALDGMLFARASLGRDKVPLGWREALEILERDGYAYD